VSGFNHSGNTLTDERPSDLMTRLPLWNGTCQQLSPVAVVILQACGKLHNRQILGQGMR
jgi:hypothetical protein